MTLSKLVWSVCLQVKVEHLDRLSYTAGFLEADGCFTIGNNGISMRITNKHLPTLERFKDWFGGSVNSKGAPLDCYDWRLHSYAAADLASQLLPYLFMKKAEAVVFIKFQDTVGPRGKKIPAVVQNHRKELRKEIVECRASR